MLFRSVAGIAFAVILMLVQLGFEQALFKSVGLLYARFNAELVLISPKYQNAGNSAYFSGHRLAETLATGDVAWTCPVFFADGNWKNPADHGVRNIFVIAFEPRPGVFDLPEVNAQIQELRQPNTVLFDAQSRPEFGPIEALLQKGPVKVDLSGTTTFVGGIFHLGTSFAADGNMILSDLNLARLEPNRDMNLPSLGLIKVKAGADPLVVRRKLQASLPNDVLVLTRDELMEREKEYWASNTPIGFVFRLGLLMGLIVGSVVVYQILYNDVSEHLAEYATLKAMGYTDSFLFGVVIKESMILSVLGFVPGVVLSQVVYWIAYQATLLPLRMDPIRVTAVYVLTAVMCVFSGALAMRRLRLADPAEIF